MQTPNSDDHPSNGTPCRKIDVILLTDNREGKPQEQTSSKFRQSAFKDTEIDPLQERGREVPGGNIIEDLFRKMDFLQKKFEELIHLAKDESEEPPTKSKKRRRRFTEMQRTQTCLYCARVYGSETALKNHLKIKHPGVHSPK